MLEWRPTFCTDADRAKLYDNKSTIQNLLPYMTLRPDMRFIVCVDS